MVDKDYGGLSKEEIARQFMLPERKSKIATLLKQDRQYCICRSTDSSRFMIGCDSCEEWYHGDCIQITEKEAKHIEQYFCARCKEEDATLHTRFKSRKRESESHVSVHRDDRSKQKKRSEWSSSGDNRSQRSARCGSCMGCYRSEDCGRCELCQDMRKFGGPGRLRGKCLARVCTSVSGSVHQSQRSVHQSQRSVHQSQRSVHQSQRVSSHVPHERRRKRKDSSSDNEKPPKQDILRQCFGPKCTRAARPGSKYCGDQCGLALAKERIYQILPQRIQEWALSPCVAEEQNKRQLDNVRKQLLEVRAILNELNKRHKELDAIIERAQQASIDDDYEDDLEDEGDTMYCITCGHEINTRTAIRHMEKCFNKYESQASFGSVYKTIGGENMFCDYYNPVSRMYCKRLRVLCPEHCKDPKIGDKEVCGCPLVTNVFDSTGEFCRAPKKQCVRHFCWDKLRRAEIDMERVRQWLKLDELIEQERQLRQKLASRAGVLALMLHSAYNHDVVEQMQKQQLQMEQQLQLQRDEEQQRLKNDSVSEKSGPKEWRSNNSEQQKSKEHCQRQDGGQRQRGERQQLQYERHQLNSELADGKTASEGRQFRQERGEKEHQLKSEVPEEIEDQKSRMEQERGRSEGKMEMEEQKGEQDMEIDEEHGEEVNRSENHPKSDML